MTDDTVVVRSKGRNVVWRKVMIYIGINAQILKKVVYTIKGHNDVKQLGKN